ncbi:putative nuclease HARBI1 isoform X2 [Maniola hyperantus]|uniref:putative nuclease HARBI1 isoform X2 n=1 Tax=Aphantopus hyperantus TaxID=2795564 RepID=UPI0015688B4B|nr:putative nuclease HARBI1 [Maniola hyperantus]
MSRAFWGFVYSLEMEKLERKLHRRSIRDASNPFELPDAEFQHLFRMDKNCVQYLCEELNETLRPLNSVDGLPVYIKILTTIRLLGDGSYQRGTGQDHVMTVAQTTVSKYLTQVTQAIVTVLMPKWITFPGTESARQNVARGFLVKHGFPDILGAIDCTHVDIFPPPFPTGVQYKNRKGRSTINVQLVVDVDCRIININARYPGRVHDQFIFNNSKVKQEMKRLYDSRIGQYYLLGDSGYALEPWMMTPDLEAVPSSSAEKYTNWHCQVRNCVERTNGYLKGTFRSLGIDRVLHYSPEKASQLIYACATLYNIMVHYRIPMEQLTDGLDRQDITSEERHPTYIDRTSLLTVARQKREGLINTHFN